MTQEPEIEWGKPPPPRKSGWGRWQLFVRELRSRPGEWGAMSTPTRAAATTVAYRLRGSPGAVDKLAEPGEFEAAARDNIVYARYVGGTIDE